MLINTSFEKLKNIMLKKAQKLQRNKKSDQLLSIDKHEDSPTVWGLFCSGLEGVSFNVEDKLKIICVILAEIPHALLLPKSVPTKRLTRKEISSSWKPSEGLM